jgi:hypothetical protein
MDTKAFLGDGNVLKLDGGDRYAAPEVWIVWHLNCSIINQELSAVSWQWLNLHI